jgi:adenosylhomocysteine nucleosidase
MDGLVQTWQGFGIRSEEARAGRTPIMQLEALGLTVACGGTGKAQFALQTQYLIDGLPSLELVICAGAAGALDERLRVGDVIVAEKTVEHDFRNRFSQRPLPSFSGSAKAIANLKRLLPLEDGFRLFFGIIASGDEDIVDNDRRQSLRKSTDALAAAWEGAGGARACRFNGVDFLEIRGITDSADKHAVADFETNLALAMENIARVIVHWRGKGSM